MPEATLTAGPLTPSGESGSAQTFSAQFANPSGASAFTNVWMLISYAFDGRNACFISLNRGANALYLADDADANWPGPAALGANTTLSNSQCAVNAAGSSVVLSGTILTLNVA